MHTGPVSTECGCDQCVQAGDKWQLRPLRMVLMFWGALACLPPDLQSQPPVLNGSAGGGEGCKGRLARGSLAAPCPLKTEAEKATET